MAISYTPGRRSFGVVIPTSAVGDKKSSRLDTSRQDYKVLYTSYRGVVIGSLVKKGFSADVAEEIVQDAFERLIRLDQERVPDHLKSYLYKIAHNLAIDLLRKRSASPVEPYDHGGDQNGMRRSEGQDASAEEFASAEQTAKVIRDSLHELPENCQKAFYLYKVRGLGYEEISVRMGVTPSMIRKHVLRAIRHCYDRLEVGHD